MDVGGGERAAVACVFDPLPIGQASGLIFTAFGVLIGAFSAYMAATRRKEKNSGNVTNVTTKVET